MIEKRAISVVQSDQRGFVSQIFLVPKKDGGHRLVVNFEGSKQVHSRGAFQDGGVLHGEGSCETRGLVGKIGSKGCLLSGADRPQSPKVSSVLVAGQFHCLPFGLSCAPCTFTN